MRKRWLAGLLIAAILLVAGTVYAAAPTVETYLEYADMEFMPLDTLRNEAGYVPIACTPDTFRQAVKENIVPGDASGDGSRFRQALADVGIPMEEAAELFFAGYPIGTVKNEYGTIRGIHGDRSLTTVTLEMVGYRLIAIFLKDESGWMLTDCLNVDNFGVDDSSPLPLLTRDDGSPGAWLRTQAIGHGTGVYLLLEEWYNVLTGQRDIGFTREGWDQIGADETYGYYYALTMDIGADGSTVPARLPFTKWTSFIRTSFETEEGDEQLAAHIITGTYGYDEATASYSLLDKSIMEDTSPHGPALDFWIQGPQ